MGMFLKVLCRLKIHWFRVVVYDEPEIQGTYNICRGCKAISLKA